MEPDYGDALVFAQPYNDSDPIEFKLIGNSVIGAISYSIFSYTHGYFSYNWVILKLPENDYITLNWVPKGEISGADENSPTYYEYDSVIPPKNNRI